MSDAADIIGIVTGIAGLVLEVISLTLQIRSDARARQQAQWTQPTYSGHGDHPQHYPPAAPQYAPPAPQYPVPAPPPRWEVASFGLLLFYGILGGATFVSFAIVLYVSSPARQVVSGLIALVGGLAMLLYVRHRFMESHRIQAFLYGVIGGAVMLATPLAADPAEPPSLERRVITFAVVIAIIAVTTLIDRHLNRRW